MTVDPAREQDPAWSPDGSEIAFNSNRIGRRFSLFKRPSSPGGTDELLVESGTAIAYPDWSPDGRVLIYTEGRLEGGVNRADLWMLPLYREGKPSVFLDTSYHERRAAFSPDGRWVAFESTQSGRSEIHVRPFAVKGEVPPPVSLHGGRAPRWREDGREIFFLAPDGTLMSAAATETARRFHASVPQSLFKTGLVAETTGNPYVVSKDGHRFLIPVAITSPDVKRATSS